MHADSGAISAAIRPRSRRHPSDAWLRAISSQRHNTFTLAQLEAEGLSARAVRHRVANGRLERLQAGAFCIGAPTTCSRWTSAVLACGENALLSCRSAAALWESIREDGRRIDVTVRGRRGYGRNGIAVHRGDTIDEADVASHRAIPCTSVARTLLATRPS